MSPFVQLKNLVTFPHSFLESCPILCFSNGSDHIFLGSCFLGYGHNVQKESRTENCRACNPSTCRRRKTQIAEPKRPEHHQIHWSPFRSQMSVEQGNPDLEVHFTMLACIQAPPNRTYLASVSTYKLSPIWSIKLYPDPHWGGRFEPHSLASYRSSAKSFSSQKTGLVECA